MTQKILCIPKCRDEIRALFKSDEPYPGEHVKFVNGLAINSYICDDCNVQIAPGELCCAHSIWVDYGGVPYYDWEDEFIKMQDKKCQPTM